MLIHLYSAHVEPNHAPTTGKKVENGSRNRIYRDVPHANGTLDRTARDAQEFELDGLISDDEEMLAGKTNGRV